MLNSAISGVMMDSKDIILIVIWIVFSIMSLFLIFYNFTVFECLITIFVNKSYFSSVNFLDFVILFVYLFQTPVWFY